MTKFIDKHKAGHIGNKIQWSMGDRDEACRLRERLEANKSTLEITLELANLTIVSAIKEDTSAIKAELAALKMQVSMRVRDAEAEPNVMLQRFLNDTVAYAESVIDPFEYASKVERSIIAGDEEPSGAGHLSEDDAGAQLKNQNQNQNQRDQNATISSSRRKGVNRLSQAQAKVSRPL